MKTTNYESEFIPTYEQLHELGGEIIDNIEDDCVQLWLLNGREYVVLVDNTVITREEDNRSGAKWAYFPY